MEGDTFIIQESADSKTHSASFSMNANAQQAVARKDLLAVTFNSHAVDNVQAKEITLSAGQRAPFHRHPCPVVGYVTKGTLIYQIQGQPEQPLIEIIPKAGNK